MKNHKLNIYILSICILALLCFIMSYILYKNERTMFEASNINYYNIIVFIVLEAFAESFFIRYGAISIGTGFVVTTAAILSFGVFGAIIIAGFGISLRILWYNNKHLHIFNTPIYKTLFNMSNMTVSTFCAGYVYCNFLGSINNSDVVILMIKFILLGFSFLVVNTTIISLLVYFLSENDKLAKIYLNNFKLGFLNIIFVSPVGILLALLYARYSILGVAIVMIPIVSLKYIFKLYIQ